MDRSNPLDWRKKPPAITQWDVDSPHLPKVNHISEGPRSGRADRRSDFHFAV
jgi:hypothetical protein